tara:strand:- start:20445 stop:21368 length:924 start_codon:yes stop_codon:yes gene_type:complete
MNEIDAFFQDFIERYPRNWVKIDDYVVDLLPKEVDDKFNFTSKYLKPHFLNPIDGIVSYTPKEKATATEVKKVSRIFDMDLVDYEEVFKEFNKDFFSIEDWCTIRLEFEIKIVREFLFSCNTFKGLFFLDRLTIEMEELKKNIDNLWNVFEPNWLQKEISDELVLNLKYLKEQIDEDFSDIYSTKTNLTKLNSKQKSQVNHWYKIAELMADGTISISKEGHYFFKGKRVEIEKKMSELVAEQLGHTIKPLSIKAYLNTTKSNKIDDKNIFYSSRIKQLTVLSADAKSKGCLSNFFKNRLEALKKEIS